MTTVEKKQKNKKKKIDPRTKGIISNFALRYPIEPENAVYTIVPGTVKDEAHDVQYKYAFELTAIPFKEELLEKNSTGYQSIFKGAINWSVSPKGNQFEGDYSWYKKKGDHYKTQASDIEGVLQRYGFSFYSGYNNQSTKIPCIIYGNLISTKLHYIGQSKAEVDTTPFTEAIINAVKSVARDIPTFRVADIRAPDYHVGVGSSYIGVKRVRSWKEPKPPRPERVSMFDVVYEQLKDRIEQVKTGGTWKGDLHTQQSLWYNALPMINDLVKADKLKKPKNRNNFLDCIRKVCNHYEVKREDIGIMAGAYSSMFYRSKWSAVNFADIGVLARMGTDIIFIEKQDIVQSLGPYASKYGAALVNTKGHLSEYAKDLSEVAQKEGAHVYIFTDYDIPGLHIASKLKDVVWLGVDEDMLRHFGITHDDSRYVIPYDPEKGIGNKVIKEDIESDGRFDYHRVDLQWLKQKIRQDNPKFKDPGNKVEIDAVLGKAGSEELWNYLMERIKGSHPERDYTRVIDVYKYPPQYGAVENFVVPSIVYKIKNYVSDRYESLTKKKREDYKEELEHYKGFTIVQDKENEIRRELHEIVEEDQQVKDVTQVLYSAGKQVESVIKEAVESAVRDLDTEKGYGIMDMIGATEEKEGR